MTFDELIDKGFTPHEADIILEYLKEYDDERGAKQITDRAARRDQVEGVEREEEYRGS